MNNLLGVWISLGKRRLESFVEEPFWCNFDASGCETSPHKRVKTAREPGISRIAAVTALEAWSPEAIYSSGDSGAMSKRVEQLKKLFYVLFTEDFLDLKLYRQLDALQLKLVHTIFSKRYKDGFNERIISAQASETQVSSFDFMKVKRMDHCEKTIMSIKLSIIKDRFKEQHYGKVRPKDLHDDINRFIFSKYFDSWVDPEKEVEISKCITEGGSENTCEMMPRRSAIFCMKRGLTKFWFKAVSTKFLDAVLDVSAGEIKGYCLSRYSIKLEEIFGTTLDISDTYFQELIQRIESPKFKLPLTFREVDLCYSKAKKKLRKLKKLTELVELADFKEQFGAFSYAEPYQAWQKGPNDSQGSSLSTNDA